MIADTGIDDDACQCQQQKQERASEAAPVRRAAEVLPKTQEKQKSYVILDKMPKKR